MNTGTEVIKSNNRLLSTVAYRLKGKTSYAIEGSIFMAGATMQWIRDELKLIDDAAESEALAAATADDLSVYLVPAFTGLGGIVDQFQLVPDPLHGGAGHENTALDGIAGLALESISDGTQ